MAFQTPNLDLYVWDLPTDGYDHGQLASNWIIVDTHNHDTGNAGGAQIPAGGIQDGAVTNAKLAANSVTTDKILNGTILAEDLADGAITANKLGAGLPFVQLGTVIAWFRPSVSFPIPTGYVICDGNAYIQAQHDWLNAGTVTVPDLRNKMVLGAATTGTGTGPSTPPAENASGGSNTANLAHTHSMQHAHTIAAHAHTVVSHTHTITGHTHPVDNHNHGIGLDGFHAHSFAGGNLIHTRKNAWITVTGAGADVSFTGTDSNTRSNSLQSLYVAGFNSAAGDSPTWDRAANMDGAGFHNHGDTGFSAPTAQANVGVESGVAAPNTSSVTLATDTTLALSGSALGSQDVRQAFVGLLYLIKVRN